MSAANFLVLQKLCLKPVQKMVNFVHKSHSGWGKNSDEYKISSFCIVFFTKSKVATIFFSWRKQKQIVIRAPVRCILKQQ